MPPLGMDLTPPGAGRFRSGRNPTNFDRLRRSFAGSPLVCSSSRRRASSELRSGVGPVPEVSIAGRTIPHGPRARLLVLDALVHNERLRVALLRVPTVVASGGTVYLSPSLASAVGPRVRPLASTRSAPSSPTRTWRTRQESPPWQVQFQTSHWPRPAALAGSLPELRSGPVLPMRSDAGDRRFRNPRGAGKAGGNR